MIRRARRDPFASRDAAIDELRELLAHMPALQAERADDGHSVGIIRTTLVVAMTLDIQLTPDDRVKLPVGGVVGALHLWMWRWNTFVQAGPERPDFLFSDYHQLTHHIGLLGDQVSTTEGKLRLWLPGILPGT